MDPHQVAALASCFIPGDKSNEQIHLRAELAKPLQQLQDSARRIAEVSHFTQFGPQFTLVKCPLPLLNPCTIADTT